VRKNRKGFEFVAEIPKEEGEISLATFRGMVVVSTPLSPPRLLKRRADGSYYFEFIRAK